MKPVSNVIVPLTVGGSATTYFCDYYYQSNPTVAEPKYALVGGSRGDAALCGVFCVSLSHSLSDPYANVGARLAFLK